MEWLATHGLDWPVIIGALLLGFGAGYFLGLIGAVWAGVMVGGVILISNLGYSGPEGGVVVGQAFGAWFWVFICGAAGAYLRPERTAEDDERRD